MDIKHIGGFDIYVHKVVKLAYATPPSSMPVVVKHYKLLDVLEKLLHWNPNMRIHYAAN